MACLAGVILVATGISAAQNTGGKFKGGGSYRGGYSPKGSLTELLQDLEVQTALHITKEQVTVIEEETEKLKRIEQKLRSHNPRTRSDISFPELIEAANHEMKRIETIFWEQLTPEQGKQIPILQIRQLGADALFMKPVISFLEITNDQSKRMENIQNESRLKAIREVRVTRTRPDSTNRRTFRSADGRSGFSSGTSSSSGKLTPEAMKQLQNKRQAIIKAGQDRMIREVLSKAQQTKFKAARFGIKGE